MRNLMLLAAVIAVPAFADPAPRPPQFAICAACHSVTKYGANGAGPNLWGIAGRKAGAGSFAYSPAMKSARIVWNHDTLAAYVQAPAKVVPGNRMPYAGQRDAQVAGAIADYLLSLK